MYKKILLAADISEHSADTARKAIELGKLYGAKVHAVHIIEPIPAYASSYVFLGAFENEVEKTAQNNLKKFCGKFDIDEGVQHVCVGHPRQKIVDFAQEIDADLIVVGTHGIKGFAKLLGSTAMSVFTHAKCDVLTVPVYDKPQ